MTIELAACCVAALIAIGAVGCVSISTAGRQLARIKDDRKLAKAYREIAEKMSVERIAWQADRDGMVELKKRIEALEARIMLDDGY